jgi:hypothetical protein
LDCLHRLFDSRLDKGSGTTPAKPGLYPFFADNAEPNLRQQTHKQQADGIRTKINKRDEL